MSPFRSSTRFTEDWDHFGFEVEDGVATLTFDRPERLNALTFDVYADLRDLLGEVEHRDDVNVLVMTGAGHGFCSGGDVDEIIGRLVDMDSKGLLEFTRMTGAVVERMRRLPIPIIAAVNGVAAGAGAVIALAADLRLMARSASFHFLFTRVGLAGADMGSAYLLPRVVGLGRASELLLLGEEGRPENRPGPLRRRQRKTVSADRSRSRCWPGRSRRTIDRASQTVSRPLPRGQSEVGGVS